MKLVALLVAAVVALGTAASTPPSTPISSPRESPEPWVLSLPGHPDVRFSAYDFRQDGFGAVDWPVEFVFHGNATVEKIHEALCHETSDPWTYCDAGGPMHLFDGTGFDANSGVKRFREDCQKNTFTAHMRLYEVKDPSSELGTVVVGTAHLDYEDHAGCSGRIHGYPDIAEAWFLEAMSQIPGWQVTPDSWDLGNASDSYVILRDLSGTLTPHEYGHDSKATDVVIP